jgi:NADH-quinone oxidoreductase subunit J
MNGLVLSAGQVVAAVDSGLKMSGGELWLFWTVSPIVVLAACALLFSKRAVVTACSVMLTMVGLAFLYVG